MGKYSAGPARRIPESSKTVFQENLHELFHTLQTTHYRLTCKTYPELEAEQCRFKGAEDLPCYADLSKCMNCASSAYTPTEAILTKLVIFYNQNITPSIDRTVFLTKSLRELPHALITGSDGRPALQDRRLLNTYVCFYPYGHKLRIGLLQLFPMDGALHAILLLGFSNQKAIFSHDVEEIMQSVRQHRICDGSLLEKYSLHVYTGILQCNTRYLSGMLLELHTRDVQFYLSYSIEGFLNSNRQRQDLGGFALAAAANGPFPGSLFKMILIHQDLAHLADPAFIDQLLNIDQQDHSLIQITPYDNQEIFEYLRALKMKLDHAASMISTPRKVP